MLTKRMKWMAMTLLLFWGLAYADIHQDSHVISFMNEMVRQHHFSENELAPLFSQVSYSEKVLEKIQAPYEAQPWYIYRSHFLTEERIRQGVKFWHRNRFLLQNIERNYGVPSEVLVALMGIESNYGQNHGKYQVLTALSTLAFAYPPRAKFFREELKEYLLLCRELKMNPLILTGSYAGAIGMPQFMPSNYRKLAVSVSRFRSPNLMSSVPDTLLSMANFLQKNGWKAKQPIAVATETTNNFSCHASQKNVKPNKTLASYDNCGITPKFAIADWNTPAALLALEMSHNQQFWLTFYNFYVITRYNTSPLYAMAVYQLSQAIKFRHQNPLLRNNKEM